MFIILNILPGKVLIFFFSVMQFPFLENRPDTSFKVQLKGYVINIPRVL